MDKSPAEILQAIFLGNIKPKDIDQSFSIDERDKLLLLSAQELERHGQSVNSLSIYDNLFYSNRSGNVDLKYIAKIEMQSGLSVLTTDLAVIEEPVKTLGTTVLHTEVPQSIMQKIRDNLFREVTDKDGKTKKVLIEDWHYYLIDWDPVLRNSIKFDYTMGIPAISYSNTTLFDTALFNRLYQSGIPISYLRDYKIKMIRDEILFTNRDYNRVTSFIDQLKEKHQNTDNYLLYQFMDYLTFDVRDTGISYPDLQVLYFELWDKFLTRMHLHIMGTRKNEMEQYIGLIENDIVPVLEGSQDLGKTTLCRWLAVDPNLYIDLGSGLKRSFGDEETIKKVRGKLIAELGEMRIMKKDDDVEQVKSFISRTTYEPNIKYVEYSNPLPATVSFIATSNPSEYLSDDTGNRRFFPIHLSGIDKDGLTKNPELAEKLHAHYARKAESIKDRFESHRVSEGLIKLMDGHRRSAMIESPDVAAILEIIPKWIEDEKLNGRDIYKIVINQHNIDRILDDKGFKKTRTTRKGVRIAMEKLNWEYRQKLIDGHRVLGWWIKDIFKE